MFITTSILLSLLAFLSFSFLIPNNSKSKITIWLLGLSASISIGGGLGWILIDCPTFLINLKWYGSPLQEFTLSLFIDQYFIIFGAVALFVTWSIIEFSHYYMETDPNKQSFLNTLILFLFFMLLLVCSNSLFLLFIGWEGVGIMSFILIGWWFTRSDANSSALQAILYNRIGDSGFILFLLFSIFQINSWNLNDIIFFSCNNLSSWAILGIIVAAAGKSAQFSLHPWLPAAMEGPTPVSALLHSSTMVVAGVFLLVRCFPLLNQSLWALNVIALLGSLTALFAASAALGQFDIKKIVAYSTTSQLGLMVVAIGLGLPWLALFHICTHAFFKALLFLCSGSIIHALNNEQDLRKMGNSGLALPFTNSTILVGSLALGGLPFLGGYYSKDLILEAAQDSLTNSVSIILTLIATLMTALYSARIVYFLTSAPTSSNSSNPTNEENPNLILAFTRLLIGALTGGWILALSCFHSGSLIIPLILKSIPLIISTIAILYIFVNIGPTYLNIINSFLSSNWYYTFIFHGNTFIVVIQNSISGVLRSLDQGWTSKFGPIGSSHLASSVSRLFQKSIAGNITTYLSYLVIFVAILLCFLIWN